MYHHFHKKMLSGGTTVVNIDNDKKCFLNRKSARKKWKLCH